MADCRSRASFPLIHLNISSNKLKTNFFFSACIITFVKTKTNGRKKEIQRPLLDHIPDLHSWIPLCY